MELEPKILYLPLKSKWYDMIESGEKKEEYREIKPYWIKRLHNKNYDIVRFSYGYTKRTMTFNIKDILITTGKEEWGANKDEKYFVIRLGERIN